MTVLLIMGLAAALVQAVCFHNGHHTAGMGWGAIQMVLLWVFFFLKEVA